MKTTARELRRLQSILDDSVLAPALVRLNKRQQRTILDELSSHKNIREIRNHKASVYTTTDNTHDHPR